jgi:hypothetical protein
MTHVKVTVSCGLLYTLSEAILWNKYNNEGPMKEAALTYFIVRTSPLDK